MKNGMVIEIDDNQHRNLQMYLFCIGRILTAMKEYDEKDACEEESFIIEYKRSEKQGKMLMTLEWTSFEKD